MGRTPTGFMTPYVDVFKGAIEDDFIIETRKNWIQDHTKLIGPGLKAASSVWLQPIFSQFDKDGDGTIDKTEFGNYLETLSWGEKPDKAKINKIMKNYDPTRDGKIDLAEFAEACPSFIKKRMIGWQASFERGCNVCDGAASRWAVGGIHLLRNEGLQDLPAQARCSWLG